MTPRPEPKHFVMLKFFQHLACFFLPSAEACFIPRPCLPTGRHSAEFSDVVLIKKAPAFSDAFVFNTASYERVNFQYKDYFCREKFSLYLAVSFLGSKESHAFLVQDIHIDVQKLATSNGGDVNDPNNLFAIFKLWCHIIEDVLRL